MAKRKVVPVATPVTEMVNPNVAAADEAQREFENDDGDGSMMDAPDGAAVATTEQPAKAPRDKVESFRRLANQRVPKLLKIAGSIANLGNKVNYTYTDAQRDKLISLCRDAFEDIVDAFSGKTKPDVSETPF